MRDSKGKQFGLGTLLLAVTALSAAFACFRAQPLIGKAILYSLWWVTLYAAPIMLADYLSRRSDAAEQNGERCRSAPLHR